MARFYARTHLDRHNHIKRCLFDCEQGRTDLALDRLHDLHEEFPENPDVIYGEALVRSHYLGQGVMARDLYEKAYHLSTPGVPPRAFAAFNTATLARTSDEFHCWVRLARDAAPRDKQV